MSLINIMLIVTTIYLGIGLVFGYFFITNVLPKVLKKDSPDEIEMEAISRINKGSDEVGRKTYLLFYLVILAVSWLPTSLLYLIDNIKFYFASKE